MTVILNPIHAGGVSLLGGPVPMVGLTPPDMNTSYLVNGANVTYTACATVGTRTPRIAVINYATSTYAYDVGYAVNVTAGQTRSYQACSEVPSSAAFAGNAAQNRIPVLTVPYMYGLVVYDLAAIAANYESGSATSSSATTLTNANAAWTVNAWTGYTVAMGQDVTAVITSNTDTVLTATGGWSDLVAGTAEDSDATSLTDSDASWSTDTWAGYTVEMDSSTATVLSNTGTVLTLDEWSPTSPTTGAYKIYGQYTIYGDTATLTATSTALVARGI